MENKRFGRLNVIAPAGKTPDGALLWRCVCDCGNEIVVQGRHLRDGHSKSCGWCQTITRIDEQTMRCTTKAGKSFLFSPQDIDLVKEHRWYVSEKGYAKSYFDDRHQSLHNLIMGECPNKWVDHINGDSSDNRRENLRFATPLQNSLNSRKRSTSSSLYKGVTKRTDGRYQARIGLNGKRRNLGYYDSPIDAAMAYDRAAFLYFGEYARPNFMKGETPNEGKQEILELAATSEERNGPGCKTRASA